MPKEIHPTIKKLYETGDNVMEQWFDSLSLSDLPPDTKKLLKQLIFFKSDIEKEPVDFSKLPTNAPLSKNSKMQKCLFFKLYTSLFW